jgi:DNA-dependent RNA polymerase auxiliary subunit epsilon
LTEEPTKEKTNTLSIKQKGADTVRQRIDELFPEYNIEIRNWILDRFKEELAGVGVSDEGTKDNPELIDKYFIENASRIKRFVGELWPRRRKKRRMIEVEREWLKATE